MNYTLLSSGCYYDTGHYTKKDFGLEVCKKTKGHLLTIESPQEQADVISTLGLDRGNVLFFSHFAVLLFFFTILLFDEAKLLLIPREALLNAHLELLC